MATGVLRSRDNLRVNKDENGKRKIVSVSVLSKVLSLD